MGAEIENGISPGKMCKVAARWVKHNYGQTSSVTEMMQSLHWRRLDQRRIDIKLSLMYKITPNLIAIPISDFLIPTRDLTKFVEKG